MRLQDLVDREPCRRHSRIVQREVLIKRRVARCQKHRIPITQWYIEMLGDPQDHVPAWHGTVAFDETQMPLRHLDVESAGKLAEAAALPPDPHMLAYCA